jgi:flagellar biosynthesis/type III secretory pathway protein FliH
MIWSSGSREARMARDVDSLMAAEWALEELHPEEPAYVGPAGFELEPAPGAREEAERAEAETRRAAEAVERRVAEAYEQGREEGRREGEIAEAARLRHALAVAEQTLDELREGEMRWTGTIEENICALAVAVARQVVGRELTTDASWVLDLVKRALLEFPIDQPVRIRVNPQDLAALEANGAGAGAEGVPGVVQGRDARWVADARLAPGGCVVEGRERIVDGRVDTALERIYRRLTYTHA